MGRQEWPATAYPRHCACAPRLLPRLRIYDYFFRAWGPASVRSGDSVARPRAIILFSALFCLQGPCSLPSLALGHGPYGRTDDDLGKAALAVVLDFGLDPPPRLSSPGARQRFTLPNPLSSPAVPMITLLRSTSLVKKLVNFHNISVSHVACAHTDPTLLSRRSSAPPPPLLLPADV